MPIIRFLIVGLLLSSLEPRADTLPPTPVNLSEEQAVALFYQRNIGLIAAKLNVEQAQAAEVVAAAIPNPVFSLGLNELSNQMSKSADSRTLPAVNTQVSQLIETAGKRGLRMEGSELGYEAVEFDLQDTVRVLTNAVRHAFYNLLLAQKSLEVALDTVERYRQIAQGNALRLKTGDIAEVDFTRIEVESLKAQGEADRAQAALGQARTDLLLLLDWPMDSLALKAEDAWPAADLAGEAGNEDKLIVKAMASRPDLKAAQRRIQQAAKLLELARRLVLPDVTVTGGYARDPGNYFTNTGMVGISLPLPIFYRQEGEIAQANVNLNTAELNLRKAEQSVRADVSKALSAWRSADAIGRRFEASVLARIEKLRSAQEFAYQKGAVGLLELIDAERNYKAMLLDYHTALANRSHAWADLLMALGEESR